MAVCVPNYRVAKSISEIIATRLGGNDYGLLQGSQIRFVLGCVIPRAGAVARSRNLGQALFGSPAQRALPGKEADSSLKRLAEVWEEKGGTRWNVAFALPAARSEAQHKCGVFHRPSPRLYFPSRYTGQNLTSSGG